MHVPVRDADGFLIIQPAAIFNRRRYMNDPIEGSIPNEGRGGGQMYQLGLREEDESRSQRSTRRVKLREAEADGEGFAEDEIGFFAFERAAFGDECDEVASGIS